MFSSIRFNRIAVLLFCFAFLIGTTPGVAEIVVNADGQSVVMEVRDATRREVLERLFSGRNIQLDWLNASYGDEKISGTFRGSMPDITRSLLTDSNFVIVYDQIGDNYQISRLVMMGRSLQGQTSGGLSAIASAMQGDPSAGGTKVLDADQLRTVAVESREYLRRMEQQRMWQLGASQAHLLQLGRIAGATGTYDNLFPGESNSAGLPPLFVPRPDRDPVQFTEYAQALTVQMAQRNLLSLSNALNAARPR